MNPLFEGLWTAVVTPFDERGEIDWPAFDRLIERQIDARVTGVVPCGTTGESPTLSDSERRAVIDRTIAACKGSSVKVAAGTGSNNTRDTVALSLHAQKQGAHALLVVTPYYNKPTFEGVKAHYEAIVKACELPIIIYHIPGRTQLSLSADQMLELVPLVSGRSRHPVAIKEASANLGLDTQLVVGARTQSLPLTLLASDDVLYWPMAALGAGGLVSVASNLIPKTMLKMIEAARNSQMAEGKFLHQKWAPLFDALFLETNPGPIKYALSKMGACKPNLRLPMTSLRPATQKRLDDILSAYSGDLL